MKTNSERKKNLLSKKQKDFTILNSTLLVVFLVLATLLSFMMYRYKILVFRNVDFIITIAFILLALVAFFLVCRKKADLFVSFLLFLGISGSITIMLFFRSLIDMSNGIRSTSSYSQYEMSIVVPSDSNIKSVRELTDVMGPVGNDSENINVLLDKIIQEKKVTLKIGASPSYLSAYRSLLTGDTKAIVWNSVFENIIENEDSNYASKIKKIYTYTVVKKVGIVSSKKGKNKDALNIYVSGIDTYGPISSVSRSDVNIILTVNRKTKEILLTTTPRDAYVAISDRGNNQYDKLTHSGIYGIDASVHTLENLYGIDINYYIRLNFTSFLKLIDLIGDISVYNNREFRSLHGNYHFPVGDNRLNSERALGFVRERYSLENGDKDRGRNQEKVVAAVIRKLASTETLKNYNKILSGVQESVHTNMDLETLMELINVQLESNRQYTVTSQTLDGRGRMDLPSYAIPGANLYVMEINPISLANASTAMKRVLEGK